MYDVREASTNMYDVREGAMYDVTELPMYEEKQKLPPETFRFQFVNRSEIFYTFHK